MGMTPSEDVQQLLDGLERVRRDKVRVIAVLWTWLERHLLELGSLGEKPPKIRAHAEELPLFTVLDDGELDAVKRAPIRNAALLLARMEYRLTGDKPLPFAEQVDGVDGEPVWAMWRLPRLATLASSHDDGRPPDAVEHPSLSTLAPRLAVAPAVHRGIELVVKKPSADSWEIVESRLEKAVQGLEETARRRRQAEQDGEELAPSPPEAQDDLADQLLSIHLDTLGDAGLWRWTPVRDDHVGFFKTQSRDAEARCEQSVMAAVDVAAASGQASVLVLPELGVTPTIADKVSKRLSEQEGGVERAPAMTVLGLNHRELDESDEEPVAPELLGDAPVAGRVNEAIVLGPTGEELWRHRKLSCAQGPKPKPVGDEQPLPPMEDIVLGRTLRVVPSPIGAIAVIICLDSFASHVRDRVEHSGAEVLLIPSLSAQVVRHRDSLQHLVQRMWGIAFVCNRALPMGEQEDRDDTTRNPELAWNDEKNRSFWVVHRDRIPSQPPAADRPSFVFELGSAVRPVETEAVQA